MCIYNTITWPGLDWSASTHITKTKNKKIDWNKGRRKRKKNSGGGKKDVNAKKYKKQFFFFFQ